MSQRPLGRTKLMVTPLAFGGNVFGWTVDEAMSFRLLDAFVDGGGNLIDTADVYSRWVPGNAGGESETILGRWLKRSGKRSRIILATKVGADLGDGLKGLGKERILAAAAASLRRLQTDAIDVYQSHVDDLDTPQEETLAAYAQLIREGKVRVIGASNFSAARLAAALAISEASDLPRYECLQPLYNLYDRTAFEAELEPLCRAKDVGVISYFSLASGFLTGKYRSEADLGQSKRGQGVKKYLNDRGRTIVESLITVAAGRRATVAQVALAYLIAQPTVTAPIASATTVPQLEELMGAIKLALTPEDLAILNQASAT